MNKITEIAMGKIPAAIGIVKIVIKTIQNKLLE